MRKAACLLVLTCLLPLGLPLACGGGTPPAKGEDEANSETKDKSAEAKGDDTAAAGSASAAASDAPPADTSAAAPAASAAPAGGGDDLKAPKDDTWSAGHQIPAGDVTKTIKAHQKQVQACYTKGKKKDPSTSGEVKVKFVISNDGKVKDVKDDSSTMSNADVTTCVGDVIKKLKFPKQKSPGDAWGTYNISF
jgi:hypothetical protein